MSDCSRRTALAAMGGAVAGRLAAENRPAGFLVENTIHMFAEDQVRFPAHPNGPYQPRPNSLEKYVAFVREAKLDHTVLVHPEPYQDDHRYLEYCFTQEPRPGYFKGICLFDPVDPQTPGRLQSLVDKHRNRIAGMRIHEMRGRGEPYTKSGAIRDRDLGADAMKITFRKLQQLGMLAQFQLLPYFARPVGVLVSGFPRVPVLIDHIGWPSRGTPEEYLDVVALAKIPNVYMKVSGLIGDFQPLIRRLYDAFGPDRLIWGSYGSDMPAFQKTLSQIDELFAFTSESDRAKIRGANAMKLFQFKG